VRPLNKREIQQGASCCIEMPNSRTVTLLQDQGYSKDFDFDRTFWSFDANDANFASQELVMQQVGQKLVDSACDGYNSCLFAYGQTGAGKTYTILGLGNGPQRGVLPRAVKALLQGMDRIRDRGIICHSKVSYMEIFDDSIRDLLVPVNEHKRAELEIRSHPRYGIFINGLAEEQVNTELEVRRLLDFGAKTRTMASTDMNATSSRSHCIFTFTIEKELLVEGKRLQTTSTCTLMDLAGSEKCQRSGHEGAHCKAAPMISASLQHLGVVIRKLADKCVGRTSVDEHVPFRNSKLTQLMQGPLSGNSRTSVIATISPSVDNYPETVTTLNFAMYCKRISMRVSKDEDFGGKATILAELKSEIAKMRQTHHPGMFQEIDEQLHVNELLCKKLEQDDEILAAEATFREHARAMALEDMGLSFEQKTDHLSGIPKLVNVSDDPSLSGCLMYLLPQGEDTKIGEDPSCTIQLLGIGIKPFMCSLRNHDDEKVILTLLSSVGDLLNEQTSYMHDDKKNRVRVNGRIPSVPHVMKHMDTIVLGFCFSFRCSIPLSGGSDSGRVREQEALQDLMEGGDMDAEDAEEVRKIFDALHDRIGLTQVSALIKTYRDYQPLIQEGNMITSTMRPKDGLRFQLEVCNDIMTFTKTLPELIVRLYQKSDSDEEEVIGSFEVVQFQERVEYMRELYHKLRITGGRASVKNVTVLPHQDAWATFSAEEIKAAVLPVETEVRELEETLFQQDLEDTENGGIRALQEQIKDLRTTLEERKVEIQDMQQQLDRFLPTGEPASPSMEPRNAGMSSPMRFAPPSRVSSYETQRESPVSSRETATASAPDTLWTPDPFSLLNLRPPRRTTPPTSQRNRSSGRSRPKAWPKEGSPKNWKP
jgi:hypothetical protein